MGLSSLPLRLARGTGVPLAAEVTGREPVSARAEVAAAFRPTATPRAPVAASLPVMPGISGAALFALDEAGPFTSAVLGRGEKLMALARIDEGQVRACLRCRLAQGRTQTVFGEGDVDAPIFFIGEGPGETEDQVGRPFAGRAGQKLDEMIAAMGLRREQVYIANVVKCRPPGNRAPAPDEVEACTPFLVKQIEVVRPKVIVTLGLPAAKYMLRTNSTMTRLRGQWQTWRGIKLMPTLDPAYILRNYTRETRAAVWSDLQKVMEELGMRPKNPATN